MTNCKQVVVRASRERGSFSYSTIASAASEVLMYMPSLGATRQEACISGYKIYLPYIHQRVKYIKYRATPHTREREDIQAIAPVCIVYVLVEAMTKYKMLNGREKWALIAGSFLSLSLFLPHTARRRYSPQPKCRFLSFRHLVAVVYLFSSSLFFVFHRLSQSLRQLELYVCACVCMCVFIYPRASRKYHPMYTWVSFEMSSNKYEREENEG